ncbi:MAG: DNA internalization-related competence protein ComEC/Rec2 [Anaerovoracaceae bacterium]
MRRNNLMITIGFILLLTLLHSAGFSFARSAIAEYAEPDRMKPVSVYGKITGMEERENGGYRMEILAESIDGNMLKKREKILVTCPKIQESPGQLFRHKIHLQGNLRLPEKRRNPRCFDYRLYLKSEGIFYQMTAERYVLDDDAETVTDRIAAWLIDRRFAFQQNLSQEYRGLISGVLFGDTSDMDAEIYDSFRANGTAHILAVSGLHLGILYSLYQKLAGNKKNPAAVILLGAAILAYGTVSMWSSSVKRAAVMISLQVAARILDLRYDMLTGLSTAAMILILMNPYVIFGAGFQMSFLAIASICFFRPVLPKKLPDSFSAMVSVQFGLFLYQMYQFNYVSLTALIANLPVVFLAGLLVPAALLCFLLFLLTGSGGFLMTVTDSLCNLLLAVNRLSSLEGRGGFDVISPPLWLVISLYLLLFFLTSETCQVLRLRGRHKMIYLLMFFCILFGFACGMMTDSPVSRADLVFVDVGQGDCIHIRDGNRNILIDGGGSFTYNVGKNVLKPYLLKNRAACVDLAVATHLHTDHYQGLLELSKAYRVKKITAGLTAGTNIKISDRVSIETLWPQEIDPEKGQEENSQCSVFMIHYGRFRILVTGDLDAEGEKEMVAYYAKAGRLDHLKADILKVGHHGSDTSTSDEFLDAVQPKAAVIQVGVYNIYGHPSGKIIEKLCQRGIIVKRNDYNGGIGFLFYEDGFQIDIVIS